MLICLKDGTTSSRLFLLFHQKKSAKFPPSFLVSRLKTSELTERKKVFQGLWQGIELEEKRDCTKGFPKKTPYERMTILARFF